MKYNFIQPKQNDVTIIASDAWYVFDNGSWREMNVLEQIEASK